MIEIERRFGIPRSTLSGWFKGITLTQKQKAKLENNKKAALVKAREKSALWHNAQKNARIETAKNQALKTLHGVSVLDKNVLELALAVLYLGEGSKKDRETSLGSSDPLILKFFLSTINKIYDFKKDEVRCELYLRADQDPLQIKQFWSNELGVPLSAFRQVSVDKRTEGSKTYDHYKGVCHIRCGNVAIQRRLVYLSRFFCEKVVAND